MHSKFQELKQCSDLKQKMALTNFIEKEDNENYFKTEELQEKLEWKGILGRKTKEEW